MKTITIGSHEVKMYDDIEDLPLLNFQKFNKYALIDAGIGSDLSDVNEHLVKAAKLIPVAPDKAARELQNLQNNINMILTETSPKMLSFAALVYSIGGELNNDLTDEGLKRFSAKLELAVIKEVNDALDDSKKKLEEELRAYFPKYFNDIEEKRANDWQRKRLLIMLEGIINPEIIGEAWRDEFEGKEDEIVAIVVNRMYEEGKRRAESGGDTEPIEPPYAKRTVQRKRRKGQPYDRVTLRDKGKFHKSLRVYYTANGFYVKSRGVRSKKGFRYDQFLESKYTDRIYGLTSGEIAEFTRQRGNLKEIALRALAKAGQWT